ncbi:MAG: Mut7-C RNAse domain-containing protein [Candidatus Aminicenantes bacterium]|nr:Mut7-C RNAse domain-containing protein [Candidatus Aminicenantes bacterium]
MKFAVDCMLGRLAKWLKILGFDTAYFSKIEDDDLLVFAQNESRVLLTRDNGLIEKSKNVPALFITSEKWSEQIQQVLKEFDLKGEINPNSRCIACNTVLKALPKERARNLVTPFIYKNAEVFSLCPECGRVFWKGTHLSDMEEKITKLLGF